MGTPKIVFRAILLLTLTTPAFALECPPFPQQVSKDWEVEVKAAVVKIGPVKGGELTTRTQNATNDLLNKVPDAGRVYLEQMMYAAYCTALRDDKTISETMKAKQLQNYSREVRNAISRHQPAPSNSPAPVKKKTNNDENSKNSRKRLPMPENVVTISVPFNELQKLIIADYEKAKALSNKDEENAQLKSKLIELQAQLASLNQKPNSKAVLITWKAISDPIVAGYKIYYGSASGTYSNVITVPGNVSQFPITDLEPGDYFYVVTAYDMNGSESDYSNERRFKIP